jgi:hypothetical protein
MRFRNEIPEFRKDIIAADDSGNSLVSALREIFKDINSPGSVQKIA